MKKSISAIALVLGFGLLSGCAPDPAEVCQHMVDLMKDDAERPRFLDDTEKCEERMEKIKQRHGVNSYRREVECSLQATTGYKLRTCLDTEAKKRL